MRQKQAKISGIVLNFNQIKTLLKCKFESIFFNKEHIIAFYFQPQIISSHLFPIANSLAYLVRYIQG